MNIKNPGVLSVCIIILLSSFYLAGCGGGLSLGTTVIDINEPTPPPDPPAGELDLSRYGECVDAVSDGTYTYMAAKGQGVIVVNTDPPENPSYVTAFDTDGTAWNLYKEGNYLYVADDLGGISILDISDPRNPSQVSKINPGRNVISLYKSGNYLYWTGGGESDGYFGVTDITIPGTPSGKAILDLPGKRAGISVWAEGNYAYIGDASGNLYVIDISSPENPVIAAYLQMETPGSYSNDIFKAGHYLYISNYWEGLYIVDVSNPEAPVLKGKFVLQNPAYDCEVEGSYAYVAYGADGLAKINVYNPEKPSLIKIMTDPSDAVIRSVFLEGNYAYMADGGRNYLVISKYK